MLSNGRTSPTQFVSNEVLDARYFKALDRFDIRFARTMWIYDNVRDGSAILHLGCGVGVLALLKRKGVSLTGVDASDQCALAARRNGYDATLRTQLSCLPFADASFDYVIGLDILNENSDEERDRVLAETKRVLRAGGVTLHGINCDEKTSDAQHAARFLNFFQHVAYEPRYALCLSSEDFLEGSEHETLKLEADFLDYLRGLSFKERRAFDMAMGYVFGKISDLSVALSKSGFNILLKASDAPLGPFYNEHRDRRALFAAGWTGKIDNGLCLDRDGEARFDDGWLEPMILPPIARWMGKQASIRFQSPGVDAIAFDLTTQIPDLSAQPLGLEILLNGVRLCAFSLFKYGWLELVVNVPESLSAQSNGDFELELRADRTAPASLTGNDGDRELSVAVCNLAVHQ